MKFLELKKHLAEGKLFPCYAAFGDDSYLLRRTAESFSSLVTVLPELNLSIFNEGASASDVIAAAYALPVISEYRVIIAPYCDVSAYLKNPSPSSVILLTAKEDKNLKCSEKIDCNKLEKKSLLSVIATKATGGITADGAELLIDYCARSMERIDSEIKKLISYKDGGVIKQEDVKLLVAPDVEYKIFELTEMIFKKNATRALTLLNEMLSEGYGAAPKIYGLLYNHFRRLMFASLTSSYEELASELGIKEYAVKMAAADAKKLSQRRLKSLLDALHEVDYAFKSGKGSDKALLENFVLTAINEIMIN